MAAHRTVLHWFESQNRDPMVRSEHTNTGPQFFVTEESPPMSYSPGAALRLDYDTWQDLGGPLTITVTVEVGGGS